MSPHRLSPLVLLVVACNVPPVEPEPAPEPMLHASAEPTAAAPSAPGSAAAPAGSDRSAWMRNEVRAPYERATTTTLAVLPPRELSGGEADARARRAFEALSPTEQEDLLEWFTVECEKLNTFQGQLITFIVDGAERDPSTWPELAPLTWYDPEVHATGQPIPRVPLAGDADEVVAVRNQILGAPGTRRLDSGWMVDYAARGLVRLPHEGDARRVFENALLGMAPDWDLAEALVELALDDGSLQKSFAAFAHAYTDRWGGVYPGVTLYDAQVAALVGQITIEMPDVDALGVVHDLIGDWDTYKSPVPAEQHDALYTLLADHLKPILHHRGLRANLARTYLCGNAELRDNYLHNLDNFHALWESASSRPEELRAKLPNAEGWKDFLQGWHESLVANPELAYRGAARHATLDIGAQKVRATLLRLLGEYGAFSRIETLPPYDAP